ncbi:glycoside hydrolase family protein [Mixta calida]|uniref:glycoside hydrolase family protein n=1 Tax=Mixta calida TaxID=665913 RepID=UPI0034D415F3
MSRIIDILKFEEGYRSTPYIDTEGFPTVAYGIKLGPRGCPISHYTFTVPEAVGSVWLETLLSDYKRQMSCTQNITAALRHCNEPRHDILCSMAWQMGIEGLAGFKNTLALIAQEKFEAAASGMLSSKWARQTPGRAWRHAEVMSSGSYDIYRGLI